MALARGLSPLASLIDDELDCVFGSLARSGGAFRRSTLRGITPIGLCSLAGGLRGFEALLARGADLSVPNHAGENPLDLALSRRSEPMARRLLALAKEGRIAVGPGALPRAVAWGWREGIEALLDMGVDVNASERGSAACIAARRDFPWALSLLASAGGDMDSRSPSGDETALMISASMGRVETMRTIIGLGADLDALDSHGRSIAWRLALRRDSSALELMLASGANPNLLPSRAVGSQGCLTALGRAARSGNDAAMKALLAAGACPSFVGWGGQGGASKMDVLGAWALGARREGGDLAPHKFLECLELAINAAPTLNHVDEEGCWPLRQAAFFSKTFPGAVDKLLAAGALIETQDAAGETLLDKLVARANSLQGSGDELLADFLLSRGAMVTPALRSLISGPYARRLLSPKMLERLCSAALMQDERAELSKLPASPRSSPRRM